MNDAKPASDIMERCQQIVNRHLQDTIPKSIDDTNIQFKTVIYRGFLTQSVRIYLKTSTENNEKIVQNILYSYILTAGN